MNRPNARAIALAGVLAALAVTVMSLGGLIPVATFILPVVCILTCQLVLQRCGSRLAWVWYTAVSILSLILCPDKEAAAVFVALGFYPMVKPVLERSRLAVLWKALLFNGVILALYWLLAHLFGMDALLEESRQLGLWGLVLLLFLGNIVFFMLDFLLKRLPLLRGNRR